MQVKWDLDGDRNKVNARKKRAVGNSHGGLLRGATQHYPITYARVPARPQSGVEVSRRREYTGMDPARGPARSNPKWQQLLAP